MWYVIQFCQKEAERDGKPLVKHVTHVLYSSFVRFLKDICKRLILLLPCTQLV